jgi:hypothetical protein
MGLNMKSPRGWFNIYFFSALLAMAAGCHSHGLHFGQKQVATIRLYLQTSDQTFSGGRVYVTRARIPMTIERDPFLDESDLAQARLIDDPDGTYAIELAFNDHGSAMLDMKSIGNRGRCIAIFSHFPPPGTREDPEGTETSLPDPTAPDKPRRSGWISAVMINGRIANGTLRFTPDATRAEAQAIVTGLKNVIGKSKKGY